MTRWTFRTVAGELPEPDRQRLIEALQGSTAEVTPQ
jgi:hypothetical protein